MNEKDGESSVSTKIYSSFDLKTKIKIIFVSLVVFILSLWYHLPVRKTVENFIATQLSAQQNCQIGYANIDISFFLPSIVLEGLNIDGRCFGRPGAGLTFDTLKIRLLFPGLLPPGARFHVQGKVKDSLINIYSKISFGSQHLDISQSKITSSLLNNLIGLGPILAGSFTLESSIEVEENWPKEAFVSLRSENFAFLKSNIEGIDIPNLRIGSVDLRGTIKEGKIIGIERAKIGEDDADIVGYFQGGMDINRANLLVSKVNMEGRFKLGEKIVTAIPLIKLFLQNKKIQDGFYRLRLSGNLGSIQPQIL